MIPQHDSSLNQLDNNSSGTKTYRLDLVNKRIHGQIDNKEAVAQMVLKTLLTERFEYLIYREDYGVELDRLVGKSVDFVLSDIERTIRDALIVDDRVVDITDFSMKQVDKHTLFVMFNIESMYGRIPVEKEVMV